MPSTLLKHSHTKSTVCVLSCLCYNLNCFLLGCNLYYRPEKISSPRLPHLSRVRGTPTACARHVCKQNSMQKEIFAPTTMSLLLLNTCLLPLCLFYVYPLVPGIVFLHKFPTCLSSHPNTEVLASIPCQGERSARVWTSSCTSCLEPQRK